MVISPAMTPHRIFLREETCSSSALANIGRTHPFRIKGNAKCAKKGFRVEVIGVVEYGSDGGGGVEMRAFINTGPP